MAAMAGLLGVALDKPGVYRLNDEGGTPGPETIGAAWRLVALASALMAALTLIVVWIRG